MTPTTRRRLWLALIVVILIALLAYALLPKPAPVQTAEAVRGPLQVSVDEEGKTRVKERYVVSAPLGGRLLRITLDPGDPVSAGQTLLASIEPAIPEMLDRRALAQSEAQVRAADASLSRTQAQFERAGQADAQAQANLERLKELFAQQMVSQQEYDDALFARRMAADDLRSARFAVQVARSELAQAKAALLRIRQGGTSAAKDLFPLEAPVDGQVLRVLQESATVVTAGTPLVEVGNPQSLEVVVDVLSSDAVRVRPGNRVLMEQWGGGEALEGRVRRVEPAAYTKVSALGVEEQRVDVIVDLSDPVEKRPNLGDGYRVEARIIVWTGENILKIPSGALFRHEGQWAVFAVQDGRARLHRLHIGHTNGVETEVLDGLAESQPVIIHPSDKVHDGGRVKTGR